MNPMNRAEMSVMTRLKVEGRAEMPAGSAGESLFVEFIREIEAVLKVCGDGPMLARDDSIRRGETRCHAVRLLAMTAR